MRRGEIWWAELPYPAGPRPVLILTRDAVLERLDNIVVAAVTRTFRGLQSEVTVGRAEGLPHKSVVNLDNLFTVNRQRLRWRLGGLTAEKTADLDTAIRYALGVK